MGQSLSRHEIQAAVECHMPDTYFSHVMADHSAYCWVPSHVDSMIRSAPMTELWHVPSTSQHEAHHSHGVETDSLPWRVRVLRLTPTDVAQVEHSSHAAKTSPSSPPPPPGLASFVHSLYTHRACGGYPASMFTRPVQQLESDASDTAAERGSTPEPCQPPRETPLDARSRDESVAAGAGTPSVYQEEEEEEDAEEALHVVAHEDVTTDTCEAGPQPPCPHTEEVVRLLQGWIRGFHVRVQPSMAPTHGHGAVEDPGDACLSSGTRAVDVTRSHGNGTSQQFRHHVLYTPGSHHLWHGSLHESDGVLFASSRERQKQVMWHPNAGEPCRIGVAFPGNGETCAHTTDDADVMAATAYVFILYPLPMVVQAPFLRQPLDVLLLREWAHQRSQDAELQRVPSDRVVSSLACTITGFEDDDLTAVAVATSAPKTLARLFLVYQLAQVMHWAHSQGRSHGCLCPSVIDVDAALSWLQVRGWFSDPVDTLPAAEDVAGSAPRVPKRRVTCECVHCRCTGAACAEVEDVTAAWVAGAVSNLDYLLHLNRLAGRRVGDPTAHPVVPWVIDFVGGSVHACGRRDLSRSKFRLAKGDAQLDFTYEHSQPRHHVPEPLSDLTYFNYVSRRTPVPLLQRYVRPKFEPNEYPASMQRLYAWTPDECIPEFFLDHTIFAPAYNHMPELQLPEWAQGDAELFVRQHRSILESDEVSMALHHWIDLTFGYALSGPAAVEAKNVPLPSRGVGHPGFVQLFRRPHVARATDTLLSSHAADVRRLSSGTRANARFTTSLLLRGFAAVQHVSERASFAPVYQVADDAGASALQRDVHAFARVATELLTGAPLLRSSSAHRLGHHAATECSLVPGLRPLALRTALMQLMHWQPTAVLRAQALKRQPTDLPSVLRHRLAEDEVQRKQRLRWGGLGCPEPDPLLGFLHAPNAFPDDFSALYRFLAHYNGAGLTATDRLNMWMEHRSLLRNLTQATFGLLLPYLQRLWDEVIASSCAARPGVMYCLLRGNTGSHLGHVVTLVSQRLGQDALLAAMGSRLARCVPLSPVLVHAVTLSVGGPAFVTCANANLVLHTLEAAADGVVGVAQVLCRVVAVLGPGASVPSLVHPLLLRYLAMAKYHQAASLILRDLATCVGGEAAVTNHYLPAVFSLLLHSSSKGASNESIVVTLLHFVRSLLPLLSPSVAARALVQERNQVLIMLLNPPSQASVLQALTHTLLAVCTRIGPASTRKLMLPYMAQYFERFSDFYDTDSGSLRVPGDPSPLLHSYRAVMAAALYTHLNDLVGAEALRLHVPNAALIRSISMHMKDNDADAMSSWLMGSVSKQGEAGSPVQGYGAPQHSTSSSDEVVGFPDAALPRFACRPFACDRDAETLFAKVRLDVDEAVARVNSRQGYAATAPWPLWTRLRRVHAAFSSLSHVDEGDEAHVVGMDRVGDSDDHRSCATPVDRSLLSRSGSVSPAPYAMSGVTVHAWRPHDGYVVRAMDVWGERLLATGSKDGSVRLWDIDGTDAPLGHYKAHGHRPGGSVHSIVWASDATWIASAASASGVYLWSPERVAGDGAGSVVGAVPSSFDAHTGTLLHHLAPLHTSYAMRWRQAYASALGAEEGKVDGRKGSEDAVELGGGQAPGDGSGKRRRKKGGTVEDPGASAMRSLGNPQSETWRSRRKSPAYGDVSVTPVNVIGGGGGSGNSAKRGSEGSSNNGSGSGGSSGVDSRLLGKDGSFTDDGSMGARLMSPGSRMERSPLSPSTGKSGTIAQWQPWGDLGSVSAINRAHSSRVHTVLVGTSNGRVIPWDVRVPRVAGCGSWRLRAGRAGASVRCVASVSSACDSLVGMGTSNGLVAVLEARTGLILTSWRAHAGSVHQVSGVDGRDDLILTCGGDKQVRLWQLPGAMGDPMAEPTLLTTFVGHSETVTQFCQPEPGVLISASGIRIGLAELEARSGYEGSSTPMETRLRTVKMQGMKLLSPISHVTWLALRKSLLVVNDDYVRLCQ